LGVRIKPQCLFNKLVNRYRHNTHPSRSTTLGSIGPSGIEGQDSSEMRHLDTATTQRSASISVAAAWAASRT
jgi:hypothetical protein